MPKGCALIIGLRNVNPQFYGGNDGSLFSPEEDALAMEKIVKSEKYDQIEVLLTEEATQSRFLQAMDNYQKDLKEGDLLLITFAGHGGLLVNEDDEEADPGEGEYDETLCFFDGQICDDKIYDLLAGFRAGVRILFISDSCHSGSIIRVTDEEEKPKKVRKSKKRLPLEASVLLISSAQEDALAYDGDPYSKFTAALLDVWDDGKFEGNYQSFYDEIVVGMELNQTPNFLEEGKGSFRDGRPFKV